MTEKEIPLDDVPAASVVAPTLHEMTLEQVLQTTPVQLQKDDRIIVRIHDPFGDGDLAELISIISQDENIKCNTIITTAVVHGFAIVLHENEDIFKIMRNIRREGFVNNYSVYKKIKSGIAIRMDIGRSGGYCHIDFATHENMTVHAKLLKTSLSTLATVCICKSLLDSSYLPPDRKAPVKTIADTFNYSCNIIADVLDDIKY